MATGKKTSKKQALTSKKPSRDENGRLLPGNSANPNGRPKGKKNWRTVYEEACAEAAKDIHRELAEKAKKAGLPEPEPLTADDIERMIEKRAVKESIQGNFQYYRETRDRNYGKTSQPIGMDDELKEALAKMNTIIPD